MPKQTLFQYGFQKMLQNLFVMKTNSKLRAKGGKTPSPKPPTPPKKPPPNPPKQQEEDPVHARKAKMWKMLSVCGAIPTVGGVASYVFFGHKEKKKERPPFVAYEYLRIRRRRYPWGDGVKTFFHNPHVNALPDGYED